MARERFCFLMKKCFIFSHNVLHSVCAQGMPTGGKKRKIYERLKKLNEREAIKQEKLLLPHHKAPEVAQIHHCNMSDPPLQRGDFACFSRDMDFFRPGFARRARGRHTLKASR